MNYLLIACNVFQEIIEDYIKTNAKQSHTITPIYLKIEAHLEPRQLHQDIQKIIDQADHQSYDMILLAYGLCGNASNGITARSIPIMIPKAHDCCTLFLGSISRFIEHFGDNLSAQWTSSSYLDKSNQGMYSAKGENIMGYFGLSEEFDQLVKDYGEDNAQYLWETLHAKDQHNKKIFYIATDAPDDDHNIDTLKQKAKEEGKEFHLIQGNPRLIHGLLKAEETSEYLVLAPGESIIATNDLQDVMKVKKSTK